MMRYSHYDNPIIYGTTACSRSTTLVEPGQRSVELEEARDAALAAANLKPQFLANMSHEIRTPMNGALDLTGMLLDTELDKRFNISDPHFIDMRLLPVLVMVAPGFFISIQGPINARLRAS